MIWQKKIKQHTYLWSDAEWRFCCYQVVTYVQVSSIHIASSISKLIFGGKKIRAQFLKAKTSAVWVREAGPGCRGLEAMSAVTWLPLLRCLLMHCATHIQCWQHFEIPALAVSLEFHTTLLGKLPLVSPGPNHSRVPALPCQVTGLPTHHCSTLLLLAAPGTSQCVPSSFGSLLPINLPSPASFQPAALGLLPCHLPASFLHPAD